MKCPTCGGINFAAEFNSDGAAYKCLKDGTVFSASNPDEIEETFVAPPPRAETKAPVSRALVTPKDVVRDARAQLRVLEAEIKRLQKLIPQRDALKRLLAAAVLEPARAKRTRRSKEQT